MRSLLLVITLIFVNTTCLAAETFAGYILQKGNQFSLKTNSQQYVLVAENNDVKLQIYKLRSNDFISGLGHVTGNVIRLQTLDFVGLSSFLGLWLSPMGLFQVQDFSNLSLHSSNQTNSSYSNLNYSITPDDGAASWGMFLTDADQIYFTNLKVTETKALIRFFDTQTGAFQREVTLSKISR